MWFVVLKTSVLLRGGGMRQASPSALLDCSHAMVLGLVRVSAAPRYGVGLGHW